MSIQKKPLLSIGMIFKNEIRCLERCMKSLQPLRDAIPCELVMADTGSDDGSREVAERYADILFDFPWINDFAAARNAVMERCSGKWYFSLDADEWLDEDISELLQAMHNDALGKPLCAVMIRNFFSEDMRGDHSDFLAMRIVRMDTGARYSGAIHEHLVSVSNDIYALMHMVVKHDGYMFISKEKSKEKYERNMSLLRKKLEADPQNLMTLLQCIESSSGSWEHEGFLRRAVAGVEERYQNWRQIGPPIMRHAVNFAESNQLEEEDKWIALTRDLFPASPFTVIDVAYAAFFKCLREKNTQEAIAYGEGYLKALEDYRSGRCDPAALIYSTLGMVSSSREFTARILLSSAYVENKEFDLARQVFDKIDTAELSGRELANYLGVTLNLHAQGGMDMSQTIAGLWEYLNSDKGDAKRRKDILEAAGQSFTPEHRQRETEEGYRHAYTAFLSLGDKYEIGLAAAILDAADPGVMAEKLSLVENWGNFPIHALVYALESGVAFPLPEKPLRIEEMDKLAIRLGANKESFLPLAVRIAEGGTAQQLAWKRSVMTAAVRAFAWSGEDVDAELGLSIARSFAHVEKVFLPSCYAPDIFQEENLFLLPSMHRFGWYCAQAFDALEAGELPGYLRCLRQGLSVCEAVQPMVEFLTEHTPQLQTASPSQELLELADKVRTMLSAYDPSDPTAAAIKQTPAYRKVAYLIEGIQAPVFGGLAQ